MSVPTIYLARHGETEWSKSGQHTGRTDLPLTPAGEDAGRKLGPRLAGVAFGRVFSSPMARARRTAELAGFAPEIEPDLLEWNYGDYEGKTSADIRAGRPDWLLFRDGCPNGESPDDMAVRVDAARLLVRRAARAIDAGRPVAKEAAMAKLFASETAMFCTWAAVQTLGGWGYSREYPVEKWMRDAKLEEIEEGTSEIQRLIISRRLLA